MNNFDKKNIRARYIILLYIFFSFTSILNGQVLINEVCPSNKSVITDSYYETPDWIELYNPSNSKIVLDQIYLSDDYSEWDKFLIPSISIEPDSFVIIWASDRDEINEEIHTNFKLSSAGESVYLSNSTGQVIDSIAYPALSVDHSFGRYNNGENTWKTFDKASPLESNNNSIPFELFSAPSLNYKSGIYRNKINVILGSNPNNYLARYTDDGSPVSHDSPIFEELIIEETTNLRLAFINSDGSKGLETNVIYFFNLNHNIPVVHISTDPEHLFDQEKGIFKRGPDAEEEYPFYGANFWKDIEVPIIFTFFEENNLTAEYSLGAKIHGGKTSRTNPMQSLRLIAEEEFGTDEIDYPFFKESDVTKYKRLVLRNASGDYNFTHFRDGYLARYFAKEELDLDLLQFRPTVVYINGEYYGLLHIREKIDKYYIKEHYGLEATEIDLLEKDTQIVEGDFNLFEEQLAFLLNADLSIDSNFNVIKQDFDVDHFTDYFAAQSIVNNTDWPRNNIKYWREKDNGKWRYVLFDMDVSMGRYDWTKADRNYIGEHLDTVSNARYFDIMSKLWENEKYSDEFVTRYSDLLNTTFRVENWMEETVNTKENLEVEIKRQFDNWSNGGYDWWTEKGIPRLYTFIEEREDYAREFLRERFGLSSPEQISIITNPPGAGFIDLNTITLNKLPWDGFYFNEIESSLIANSNPGFQFSHWEIIGNAEFVSDLNTITIKDFDNIEIIAHYTGEFLGLNANVFPNPSNNSFTVQFVNNIAGKVEFSIFDTMGRLVSNSLSSELPSGQVEYSFTNLYLDNGIYFLNINLGEYEQTIKIIISND